MAASVPHQVVERLYERHSRPNSRLETSVLEETGERRGALFLENSRSDGHLMIEARVLDDVVKRERGPRFRILGAVHQSLNPRED